MWFDKIKTSKGLKKKYRELVKIYHPDNKISGNASIFNEITNIYKQLLKRLPSKIIILNVTCNDIMNKIPVNVDKSVSLILPNKHCQKYSLKKTIDGESCEIQVNIKDYPSIKDNIIVYVSLDDIKNHKQINVETIDGFKKCVTIPFKDGRMVYTYNKRTIELRIKEEK